MLSRAHRLTQRGPWRARASSTAPTKDYDLGIAARLRGDLHEAALHLDAAVHRSSTHNESAVRSLLAAGDVHCLLGNTARARARYELALERQDRAQVFLPGDGGLSGGRARCLFSLGALARREGQFQEAAKHLLSAIAENTLPALLNARATGMLAELDIEVAKWPQRQLSAVEQHARAPLVDNTPRQRDGGLLPLLYPDIGGFSSGKHFSPGACTLRSPALRLAYASVLQWKRARRSGCWSSIRTASMWTRRNPA